MEYQTQNLKKLFGLAVKELRTRKKLTQEELAALTGLHRTYIGSVERGERNISIENIARIAHALDIKISKLMEVSEGFIKNG